MEAARQRRRRPGSLALRVVVRAIAVACGLAACSACSPAPDRVHDRAGFLAEARAEQLNRRLAQMYRESGIDAHLLFEGPAPGTSLELHAMRRFENLGVGARNTHARGLLLVVDTQSQRLRIEVGYGLEGIFPDAFVGYLIDEHARFLFDAEEPDLALRLTLRMIEYRVRTALLGGAFHARPLRHPPALRHGSGGGGATQHTVHGRSLVLRPEPGPGRVAGEGLDATPSASLAYERYLLWLTRGAPSGAEILTAESRSYLASLSMTPALLDHIMLEEAGRIAGIFEVGDRALLYTTNEPISAPLFFRRSDAGWQVDVVASLDLVIPIAGGAYVWSLRASPELEPFADQLTWVDGFLRVRRGDNRPLPVFEPEA